MPLQNRVTPFGEIVAIPERGTMMGNRGILHDGHGQVHRRWASKLWICCLLEFQGRRDPVMAPGHYTRLFFLDEPTALAAGHRPCAYCRRYEYNAFRSAWAVGNPHHGLGEAPRAPQMDAILQEERIGPGLSKRLHRAHLERLPDGVFFIPEATAQPDSGADLVTTWREHDVSVEPGAPGAPDRHPLALLLWRNAVWRWTPAGYRESAPARPGPVLLLTPPSIVGALAGGYEIRPPFGLS